MSLDVLARRYLCRSCGAVITVVPCSVLAGRLYAAPAIAFAVALYGAGESAREVRRRVSPWRTVGATAASGWASLRRWIRAIGEGRLFPRLRIHAERRRRATAERAGAALAAFAPPTTAMRPLHEQAFFGGAQMA